MPRKVREALWIFRRVHFHPGSGDLENVSKTLTVAPIFHFSLQNIPWGVPRTLLFTQHSGSRLPVLGSSPVPPVHFWEVMTNFHKMKPTTWFIRKAKSRAGTGVVGQGEGSGELLFSGY